MDMSPHLSGRRWRLSLNGLRLACVLLAQYFARLLLYGGGSNPGEVHCVGSKGASTRIPRRGLIFTWFQHVSTCFNLSHSPKQSIL